MQPQLEWKLMCGKVNYKFALFKTKFVNNYMCSEGIEKLILSPHNVLALIKGNYNCWQLS